MAARKCPFCANQIQVEARKCQHCHENVSPGVCLKCGKPNRLEAKYCGHCGSNELISDPAAVERARAKAEAREQEARRREAEERRREEADAQAKAAAEKERAVCAPPAVGKSGSRGGLVMAGLFCALAVAAVVYSTWRSFGDRPGALMASKQDYLDSIRERRAQKGKLGVDFSQIDNSFIPDIVEELSKGLPEEYKAEVRKRSAETGKFKIDFSQIPMPPSPISTPAVAAPTAKPAPAPAAPERKPPEKPSRTKRAGMSLIPAGGFLMGSADGEGGSDEHPRHKVSLDAYYMDKYEATFVEYDKYCGATGKSKPSDSEWGRGSRPVINVSWDDAKGYCEWAGKRLPTEAEWEKAARGGTDTKYSFGNDEAELGGYAWYDANSGNQTHPVGEKKPNQYGLYDMHGNVWEWVSDWYDENYYKTSPGENPKGPDSGTYRGLRGGSWVSVLNGLRAAYRYGYGPGNRIFNFGFRCVVSARD